MRYYTSYGLTILSDLRLPELRSTQAAIADVRICRGREQEREASDLCSHLTPREASLCWEGIGSFRIREGRDIVVDASPGVDEALLRLPLLGAVMAVLLYQRGYLVLHASAVAVGGCAVLFLGAKGQGKSTFAASLLARGHGLISDDVVAVRLNGEESPVALPGYRHVKLWPDAVVSVTGRDPGRLPRLHAESEKCSYRVPRQLSRKGLPVRRIYALEDGLCPQVERLPPREALQQILRHSYVARFSERLLEGGGAPAHFLQCVRLAGVAPVCRLRRRRSLAELPDLARRIEEDLGRPVIPCDPGSGQLAETAAGAVA